MGNSSQNSKSSLVTFSIKVEGNTIPDQYSIHSVFIEQGINKIAFATITILDGSASKETFAASSSSHFVPGNSITIEAGYDTHNSTVFEGIITKQSLRIDNSIGSALEIDCRDKSIKMTVGRKSKSYTKMTDSDIISQLISNSGASADVTSTSDTLPEVVQYYTTDWDFMISRAEVNSLVVSTVNGKVSVFDPGANNSSVFTITYGQNMYSFHGDLNSVSQLGSVSSQAWSYKDQDIIKESANNSVAGPGNISSKKLSDVIGLSDFVIQTTGAESSSELTTWAKGQMTKSEYSKIIGEVDFQGNSSVKPGVFITLKGLGDRFNGDHFVSQVTHTIEDGNWVTTAKVGMSPQWFVQEHEVSAPLAAGLLPGIQGLFNGTVKKIYEDPDSEYRILVNLPLLDPDGDGIWARLTNFYSTSGAGAFFLPEVNDEVIVGFLNDDPRYPIILGSVYSSKNKPYSDLDPNENNSVKAIVTKSELRVLFNDEKKILTITTPNNNKIELNDESKEINISDENNNSIKMSESGIDINSPKSISIKADETVSIEGTNGITLEASGGDVSISGMNIQATADTEFSAQGNATASVQGGGELTLKAAMVMIN